LAQAWLERKTSTVLRFSLELTYHRRILSVEF
jgi:hypothetical protein